MTREDSCLSVQCSTPITAHEGRLFDYVLSRIQALGLSNTSIRFCTDELLGELGHTKRTENRTKILDSLCNLVGITVTLSFDEEAIALSLLESVQKVDGNRELLVILSQSFIDAMDVNVAKTRYINIERTMKAKSAYTLELAKLLQMDGGGVQHKSGIPQPIKQITHERVCQYLSLDSTSQSARSTLRKAFNELEKLRYPHYTYNGHKQEWQLHN